ncbi:hypothetical protein EI555_009360, partial [Monodon monoceros]
GAARGARVTTKPPRAAGEDGEDAGTASSILSQAPPPSASPRPQTPRLFAPQPGRGPGRREEKKEGEREKEEVVWLSPGIRLGAEQGCGRRQLIRPRGSGRAGLGRGCSHSAHPGSGPPPSLAAQSPSALTLRVGAARTLASADANPPRALRAEPGRSGWLWGNLLGTGLAPPLFPRNVFQGSRLGAGDPGRKWTQPMVVDGKSCAKRVTACNPAPSAFHGN